MLLSKYGFTVVAERYRIVLDPSQVAARIVLGVGFTLATRRPPRLATAISALRASPTPDGRGTSPKAAGGAAGYCRATCVPERAAICGQCQPRGTANAPPTAPAGSSAGAPVCLRIYKQ